MGPTNLAPYDLTSPLPRVSQMPFHPNLPGAAYFPEAILYAHPIPSPNLIQLRWDLHALGQSLIGKDAVRG